MESSGFYENMKKHQAEDRAKLVMQQLKTYHQTKQQRKWWQKISAIQKTKTKPASWTD